MNRARADVRLGYGAVGLSALAFIGVLSTTLVVQRVVPALLDPDRTTQAQEVRTAGTLRLDAGDPTAQSSGSGGSVAAGTTTSPASGQDTGQGDGTPSKPAGSGGQHTPSTPDVPQPPPSKPDGPVSSTLDPLVGTTIKAVDGLTGGSLSPVTGTLEQTLDTTTDVLDQLVDSLPVGRNTGAQHAAANHGLGHQGLANQDLLTTAAQQFHDSVGSAHAEAAHQAKQSRSVKKARSAKKTKRGHAYGPRQLDQRGQGQKHRRGAHRHQR